MMKGGSRWPRAYGVGTLVPHCAYFGAGLPRLAPCRGDADPAAVPFERLYLDLEASPYAPVDGRRAGGKVAVAAGTRSRLATPDPAVESRNTASRACPSA